MKKTITALKTTVFVLAIITLALVLYAFRVQPAPATPTPAATEATTEPVPEASVPLVDPADIVETDIPEDQIINSDDLPGGTELEDSTPITGEPQIYAKKDSSLEAEPGVTPDMITGRIFEGYPAAVDAMPMNRAICRNLTMDGVDMDVPVNLLFKWEDIKHIKPGDGIQLHDKLILVENVLYEDDIDTPGLIAINTGKYFLRHHPALYGGGSLGWGTTEQDCMFVYDEYFSAKTIVRDVHIDFNYPQDFYFAIDNYMVERNEFVERLTGKIFQATGDCGSYYGTLGVDNYKTDVIDAPSE